MLFPLIETNALYAYALSDLHPLLRTCAFMCALSLSCAISLMCSPSLLCALSHVLYLSLFYPCSVFTLSFSHFSVSVSVSLYLAMLMATSSLAVLVRSRKSWLSRVGRNWTYTPVSTASSDWGGKHCLSVTPQQLLSLSQSLHDYCPPYHSHPTTTTARLITVTPL